MKTLILTRFGFYVLVSFILLICQACDKTSPIVKPNKSSDNGNAYLRATVGDTTFLWSSYSYYGKYGYKSETGASYGIGGINNQELKSVDCRLVYMKDYTTGFGIWTPYFIKNSDELIMKILKPGVKEIGNSANPFIVKLTTGGRLYTSRGEQPNGQLTVETSMITHGAKKVFAQFKVSCRLYHEESNTYIDLKDGEIGAEFEHDFN